MITVHNGASGQFDDSATNKWMQLRQMSVIQENSPFIFTLSLFSLDPFKCHAHKNDFRSTIYFDVLRYNDRRLGNQIEGKLITLSSRFFFEICFLLRHFHNNVSSILFGCLMCCTIRINRKRIDICCSPQKSLFPFNIFCVTFTLALCHVVLEFEIDWRPCRKCRIIEINFRSSIAHTHMHTNLAF